MSFSTPFQRLCIRTQLRERDLGTHAIEQSHVPVFESASLPTPAIGADLDTTLRELTTLQAAALVKSLLSGK